MESLEEKVVSLLKSSPARLMSFRQLIREMGTDSDQRHEIRHVLHQMVKTGDLLKLKGNRYVLPEQKSVVAGKLSSHRDGYGFVIPHKPQDGLEGDVFVPARYIGDAIEGDTVLVSVEKVTEGRGAEGKIIKVLQRKNATIVGQFKKGYSFNYVIPWDQKIHHEILIREGDEMDAPPDSIVNVEITQFPSSGRSLRGRVVEVLGFRGDFGIDVEIIIRKHQIPVDFPPAVLSQVEGYNREVETSETEDRTNFCHLPIVTIDGETAKDFDDAVHVERTENGNYLLGVHIADVAHYVRKGTTLDREAFRRGTSVYFPDRAIPMLPEELSNGICSLKPQVARLTLSALMEIDPVGSVQRYSFHESVIRSRERMTYTSVGKILIDREPEECARYQSLVPHFELMRELALILYERRRKQGSIDFDLPEPVIAIDEFGAMVGIEKSVRNIAHRIIEEFMLTANETVARHLFLRGIPSLYRIHEIPDPVKVFEFNEIAQSFGYSLGKGDAPYGINASPRFKDRSQRRRQYRRSRQTTRELVQAFSVKATPKDYQKLLHQIVGKPEERILSYLMLRSLKQACYAPQNKGHFGLASSCYTHFTSPIRRYPDLIVHRLLKSHLHSQELLVSETRERTATDPKWMFSFSTEEQEADAPEDGKIKKRFRSKRQETGSADLIRDEAFLYRQEALEEIAIHASETERRADDAERELIDLKKLEFMADKVGDEFEGIVIHITKEGMFVELLDLFVEGFVKISTLDDDDYVLQERPICLLGRRSGKVYRLGDRLRLCVDRIDRFRRRVDLSVVEKIETVRPAKDAI